MITIGLIDNFVITRLGLTILLSEHYEKIKILAANTIQEFDTLYKELHPDLVILGNNASNEDSCLAAARQLKRQCPEIPLIVYDQHLLKNLTASYFHIGISGYILSQNTAQEMINCIQTVLDNKRFLCPAFTQQLLKSLDCSQLDSQATDRITLTERESEIASYLGQGMQIFYIATMLGRKPSTITSIKQKIFKKLNVKNVIELKEVFAGHPPFN